MAAQRLPLWLVQLIFSGPAGRRSVAEWVPAAAPREAAEMLAKREFPTGEESHLEARVYDWAGLPRLLRGSAVWEGQHVL